MRGTVSKIIAIHSFRGGTGKSNVTANLAAIVAQTGKRIAIVDTDLQSPGIYILFGLDQQKIGFSLNDYLVGRCDIKATFYDVTPPEVRAVNGLISLAPGSLEAQAITQIVQEGYDTTLLSGGLNELANHLELDYLFLDTHPGFNNETLLLMAIADMMLVILRPDSQDFQGTAITVDVARELGVPQMLMIVNKVLPQLEAEALRNLVEKTYEARVAGILPACDEMMLLGSRDLFCLRYPDHPLTAELRSIAQQITA
jgi:MinD-like ATPase involved in chromosome partitioning or flagellar assembly